MPSNKSITENRLLGYKQSNLSTCQKVKIQFLQATFAVSNTLPHRANSEHSASGSLCQSQLLAIICHPPPPEETLWPQCQSKDSAHVDILGPLTQTAPIHCVSTSTHLLYPVLSWTDDFLALKDSVSHRRLFCLAWLYSFPFVLPRKEKQLRIMDLNSWKRTTLASHCMWVLQSWHKTHL